MPGELPAPRRLSRRAEHLEAVPVRVEQAPQRLGRHRPEHVLHGYHRDDLGVRGHARAGHDQLVAELALPRVQRADRQPVPVPRGQVRPGAPLVAEPVAGLFPLFLGQRSEESRGGTRHPFGRRGRGQPVPVVHDPIIRLRPPARSCEEFAAARGWLMSMCCNGISGSCWENERPRARPRAPARPPRARPRAPPPARARSPRALGAPAARGRAALPRSRPCGRPGARILGRRAADPVDLAGRAGRHRAGAGGGGRAVRLGRAARRRAAQRGRRADRGAARRRVPAQPAASHPPLHLRLRPGRGPGRHRHRGRDRAVLGRGRLRRDRPAAAPAPRSPTWPRSRSRPRSASPATSWSPATGSGPAAGSARPRWSPTACTPGPTGSPRWPCWPGRAAWRSAGAGPTRWWAC